MSPITDRDVASRRLRAQHLVGPPATSAADVVSGLVGVQAENHAQASWAVACRTTGLTEGDVARLFDAGEILRTHVLRPTWHYVHPDDIGWLVRLTAPRIRPTYRQVQRELDIDDATLDVAAGHIVEALGEGRHLTRTALGARLGQEGLPAEGRGLMVVAAHAELSGLVCSGVVEGTQHTYALLDERAPHARRLDRDEALAEIALRYFTGHGPATERDLAYWATLTLTDVRTGLASVAPELESFAHDGRTFWCAPGATSGPAEPRGHLLQILDEYYRGYQDSRWVLDADGLAPRGREASVGMAVVDGQLSGTMRREITPERVSFTVDPLRDLDASEVGALREAGRRYGRFLGLDPVVVVGSDPR